MTRTVAAIKNPANNVVHPIAFENNRALVSGIVDQVVNIAQGYLVVKSAAELIPIWDDTNMAYTNSEFYINSPIYVYMESNTLGDTEVQQMPFYKSYYDVSLALNGVDLTVQSFNLDFVTGSDVYLKVNINQDRTMWTPVGIIGDGYKLTAGTFVIRLGSYTGDQESQDQSLGGEMDHFMLDDNNPLYYFDGQDLVPWANYIASIEKYILIPLQTESIEEDSSGNPIPAYQSWSSSASPIYGLKPGFYKVTVQRHVLSIEKEHHAVITLRYSPVINPAFQWTYICNAELTLYQSIQTTGGEYSMMSVGTLVATGFLNLESAVTTAGTLQLIHEGVEGDTFGGNTPDCGVCLNAMNNDFILIERIGNYIPPNPNPN